MKRSQCLSFPVLAIHILLATAVFTVCQAGSVDNKLAMAAAAAAAESSSSPYYYDPSPSMYAMKDPILATATAMPTHTYSHHAHAHPQPIMIPYPATNGLHSMNMADLVDITKMSKKRQAVLRRRHNKSVYADLMGDYSNQFTTNNSPLKARTEDIWALDGKAKHLEVLLLFVILAGLLLKVAFSLLWWKKALGSMAMGWGPMQFGTGGSGFGGGGGGYGGGFGGGGGGGGGGWGWRQLDETTNGTGPTVLQFLTDFVGKALDKGVEMYSPPALASSSNSTASKVTSASTKED